MVGKQKTENRSQESGVRKRLITDFTDLGNGIWAMRVHLLVADLPKPTANPSPAVHL
jgi:hypothetical protein